MASFSSLPTELLTLIFLLSNRGEPADGSRRSTRARFCLVSRACFHAVPAATDFSVWEEKTAKALAAKLEMEREWVAQEGRRARTARTTLSTLSILRVTTVRRLYLTVSFKGDSEVFANLLRATPNLVELSLNAFSITAAGGDLAGFAPLTVPLGGLGGLRKLWFTAGCFQVLDLVRILIPLKELELLDVDIESYYSSDPYKHLLPHLILPRLHELRLKLGDRPSPFASAEALLRTLATNSAVGTHTLSLKSTPFDDLEYRIATIDEPLIPHPQITQITHFTWLPRRASPGPQARAAVLAFIGRMTSLQSIKIATWTLGYGPPTYSAYEVIDPALFDTLATLPSLQTVTLIARKGKLDESPVVSFIKSQGTLRLFSIRFKRDGGWRLEQRDRVEDAAEGAGVVFEYAASM